MNQRQKIKKKNKKVVAALDMPPVIIHRNSGSLLQTQQSARPGRREQSDRQTGDGWHTVTTLTASPSHGGMDPTRNAKKKKKSLERALQVANNRVPGQDTWLFARLARRHAAV